MALRTVTKEQRDIKNISDDRVKAIKESFEYAKNKKSKVSPHVHRKQFKFRSDLKTDK